MLLCALITTNPHSRATEKQGHMTFYVNRKVAKQSSQAHGSQRTTLCVELCDRLMLYQKLKETATQIGVTGVHMITGEHLPRASPCLV